MIATRIALTIVSVATLALAGCGERPQVINYKQGTYQCKTDSTSYQVAPFIGNKQQWDNAIETRMQSQNEYTRLHD